MKKASSLVLFLLTSLSIFIFISLTPKSYEHDYVYKKIKIIEKYDAKEKIYTFNFSKDKEDFIYSLESKYIRHRGLIKKAEIKGECLTATSDYLEKITICKKKGEYVTSYYDNEIKAQKKEEYKNITIYDYNNHKYFVWNYTEFLAINQDEHEEIQLFKKDQYELELITKLKNYLLVANYDEKYQFQTMYLINSKNNKVKEVSLDKKIYFNSYILGTNKKNVYIYDLQKDREYRVNPFKETVTKNAYEILVDKKWEKVSSNKLSKKELYFKDTNDFSFEIENNTLYYKIPTQKIKVTTLNVARIIESNNKEAYFIAGESLYYLHFNRGIKKIMSFSEWNFNNKNVYIF